MAVAKKKEPTFEEAKSELDAIVVRLSGGSQPLEEMVKLYEQGAALSAYCKRLLDAYDARLMQVDEIKGTEREQ